MSEDCIFCRIVQGSVPASLVFQDEDLIAFRDINPVAPVHILIVPRRHITDLLELTAENAVLAGRIILLAGRLARQERIAEKGFRLVTNTGHEGGQVVRHLHFHVIGGRQLGQIG